jgi:hypothetical protein
MKKVIVLGLTGLAILFIAFMGIVLSDNTRALFGMSADALAGEAEVDATRVRFSKATDAQGKKEYARGLERKKLTNFGKENEGY